MLRQVIPLLMAALMMGNAYAELQLQRETTLRDSFGGVFNAETLGLIDIPGSDLVTEASFMDFHPGGDNKVVNGVITRSRIRSAEELVTTLNGELVFSGTDADGNSQEISLLLEDLVINRDGMGPELTGTVTVNGETIDASEMPGKVAVILKRVLRFLRYD